jgi:hypothetical protein
MLLAETIGQLVKYTSFQFKGTVLPFFDGAALWAWAAADARAPLTAAMPPAAAAPMKLRREAEFGPRELLSMTAPCLM